MSFLSKLFARPFVVINIVNGKCKVSKGGSLVTESQVNACNQILAQQQIFSGDIRVFKGETGSFRLDFSKEIPQEERSELRRALKKIKAKK